MDKTPMWLKALPIEMQGGEQSETQKRLRNRVSSPDLQMSALAPLYSLDSANYTKTATGGYTGHKNGKIVMDKVASTKNMKDHEGEEYTPAPLVAAAGGPEAVRKAILELAQRRVSEAGTSSFKPMADAPVITSKAEEAASANGKKTSFLTGGTVGDDEDTTNVTGLNSAAPIGSAQADINRTTKLLRDTAEGTNPYTNQIAEQARRDEAARTAAGKSELQMRMTQTGLEGPAADTAMASFDRDARIRATTAAADIAKNQQAQALQATQALAPLAIGEREYQDQAATKKTDDIAKSTSAIEGMLSADPLLTADNPALSSLLDDYYVATGATGDKAAWKAAEVARIKQYQTQSYQIRNSIPDNDILSSYFGGDTESMNLFEFQGKTGLDAFKDALVKAQTTGAFVRNPQGDWVPNMDVKTNEIINLIANPPKVVSVGPEFTGVNSTFAYGDDTYKVDKDNGDGTYELSFGTDGKATARKGADGKLRLRITQESAENSKDEDGFTTTVGDLRKGAQRFATKVTGTNQYVQVDETGEQYITVGDSKIGVTVDPIDGTIAYDAPFYANGKLFGIDGKEITVPQGKIVLTPEQATALNNGSQVTATAKDGTLFKVGSDGSVIEYSADNLLGDINKKDPAVIANMESMLKSGTYTKEQIAQTYLNSSVGSANPDPKILSFLIDSGSIEAKTAALNAVKSGKIKWDSDPLIKKAIEESVSDFSPEVKEIITDNTLMRNQKKNQNIAKRAVGVGEIIRLPDGTLGVVKKNTYDKWETSGENRRKYTYTVSRLGDGTEFTYPYAVLA